MTDRINSIDFLRGLAIIFMIQVHIYYYWIYWTGIDYGFLEKLIFLFGSLAAPFFLIVSGISYYFFLYRKIIENENRKRTFYEVIKRSLFIFTISTIFQFLFGFIFNIRISFIIQWSIFQVISFSMLFFFYIPFLNGRIRMISYLSLLVLIILLKFISLYLQIMILNVFVDGIFSFIPWVIFFLFGLILSDFMNNYFKDKHNRYLYIFIPLGIILLIISVTNVLKTDIVDNDTIEFYLMSLGAFIVLFSINYYFLDLKKVNSTLLKMIIKWGKLAFSIYYIQYGILAAGMIIFPIIFKDLYLSGFLPYQYIITLFTFLILLEIIIRLWKKYNYIFGLEWIMNKLSNKSLFSKTVKCN